MSKISPFLWFNNEAEEAARFYTSIFKNSKITKISRYGDSAPMPKGTVMVVEFEMNGQTFMALNGGPVFKFNESVSFVVHCENQEEVDYYWEKLTQGGKEVQCGWLKDKYGLSWQVVPTALGRLTSSGDAAQSSRVMAALMKMVKLDIAALEAAAKG
ncbi:MAG TPA: VOC family protein [Terriglobales bacterium]|nr:VOC family protein [Terriglobales bacterium]